MKRIIIWNILDPPLSFIKTPRYGGWMLFVLMVVYLYNLLMSIMNSIKFWLNDFLWLAIFDIFKTWAKYLRLERICYLIWDNRSFICKHHQPWSNEIGETFCKGLKWMFKLFDMNWQKFFRKTIIFSKFSKHFIIEIVQGNSY